MRAKDPNLLQVEAIATALGTLRDQLVLVGGCATGLLLTDPAAAPARATFDVDLLAEVVSLHTYHRLEAEFARIGFRRDMDKDAPICRWRFGSIAVDLMPTDANVLGFSNRWYPLVAKDCQLYSLPSSLVIRLISASAFIATKLEAFDNRGNNDYMASHDLEDIMIVVDGRPKLVDEILYAPDIVRSFITERCRALLKSDKFMDALPGFLVPDESHSERLTLLQRRLEQIAEYK